MLLELLLNLIIHLVLLLHENIFKISAQLQTTFATKTYLYNFEKTYENKNKLLYFSTHYNGADSRQNSLPRHKCLHSIVCMASCLALYPNLYFKILKLGLTPKMNCRIPKGDWHQSLQMATAKIMPWSKSLTLMAKLSWRHHFFQCHCYCHFIFKMMLDVIVIVI